MCIDYYCTLLEKLEERTGVGPNNTDAADFKTAGLKWLKDVYYQCFIHLGDLARYQVTVGGNHYTAVAYYHHAIALDPSQGASYNQLAALVGNRNEQLDAAYYYQRSVTSSQPFSGSLSNLTRIYEKNQNRLETIERKLETTTEQDIREFTRDLLLVRFLRLQQMLQPTEKSVLSSINEKELEKLCRAINSSLEDCLDHDLALLASTATVTVMAALRSDIHSSTNQEQYEVHESIPHDVMLKMCALAVLASHTLRSLGSTFTTSATSFALSVFSQLLHYAHRRLTLLLTTAVALATPAGQTAPPLDQYLDQGDSMVEILQKVKFDVSQVTASSAATEVAKGATDISKQKQAKTKQQAEEKKMVEKKKKRLRKVLTRRRRRRGGDKNDSSEEECEVLSSSDDESTASDDDTLSMDLSNTLGEDDLEMLERLSDCSSSEDEGTKDKLPSLEKTPPNTSQPLAAGGMSPASVQKKAKRQIILAANFSNAPRPKLEEAKTESELPHTASGSLVPSSHAIDSSVKQDPTTSVDNGLLYLMEKTGHQSIVYSVCCLVAEESYLMSLRVFMEWVQSYPIAVATSTQGLSGIWSHLASLINFLPSEDELSCLDDSAKIDEQFTNFALLEDIALRGFPPLVGYQASLVYNSHSELTSTKQAAQRVRYCTTFGRFVADLRTVPSFSWDLLTNKFIGAAQKQQIDEKRAKEKELEQEKQAQLQRSKLMNAMAQQKLQHEVATLEVSAKKQATFFTPYLVPDAHSLCTGLHLVKKLLTSEKFIFVIAKSTIEELDSMKKGRDNYAAREVIKFLEREFKDGHKFIRAQQPEESISPSAKKSSKMDIDIWHLDRLIDCAVYYNQSFSESGQDKTAVTLLLHKKLLKTVEDPGPTDSDQLMQVVHSAWQHGVELDSVMNFHSKWQKKESTKRK
ncbi:nonsense-mediated mRNA decay factor SMG5-like isoform X3 [Halichondria panicea]